jgi:hypothetical protein
MHKFVLVGDKLNTWKDYCSKYLFKSISKIKKLVFFEKAKIFILSHIIDHGIQIVKFYYSEI